MRNTDRFREYRLRLIAGGLLALVWASGCSSVPSKTQRQERYRPQPPAARPLAARPAAPVPVPVAVKPAAPAPAIRPAAQPAPALVLPTAEPPAAPAPTPLPAGTNREPHKITLKVGDRVQISVRGVVDAQDYKVNIGDRGMVNLLHIDDVKIVGMTTSEAEKEIQRRYIEGQFYSKVTVNVVAELEEVYVAGLVIRPGTFPLTAGMTLRQAVTAAGGFQPFGNRNKVYLRRGLQISEHDFDRIDERKEPDPLLEARDMVEIRAKGALPWSN